MILRNYYTLVFLLIFSFTNAQNLDLNGSWSFKIDPYFAGEEQGWFKKNINTKTWSKMEVPGNWDLINEYADYAGNAWYSRTFQLSNVNKNKQVHIFFQSVYNTSKVWINGHFIGKNDFGFLPFNFDITKYIYNDKPNRVTVLVNNTYKSGAMWNWGGIRRPVWLEITPPIRIVNQHIDAIPNLDNGTAKINIKIKLSNSLSNPKEVIIKVKIKRKNNEIINDKIKTTVPPNIHNHIVNWSCRLKKSKVDLWHFDDPNLYESKIVLSENDTKLHEIKDKFGIRKLEINGLKLLLNGESIRPVGFNVVPEDRFTGNTLPKERIQEDVDLMKSLGVNMARLSHVSLPKEYLDYLDEKGIMVFEEVGLWGKDALVDPDHPKPKEWLQRLVEVNYNHPSLVGWSVGNEIGKVADNPKVDGYVKSAVKMAKELDPNRLALYVSHTAKNNPNDAIKHSDLAMINLYGGWGKGTDATWKNHKMPIFVSEFGNNGLNSDNPNLGISPIKKMMDQMRYKEYVFGASLWTLNDYRSKYYNKMKKWQTPPSQNRPWGIVTSFRDKKRAYFELKKEYAPVKNLTISSIDLDKGTAEVEITPRDILDIPSNILRNYCMKWSVLDNNFNQKTVDSIKFKIIKPGDPSFKVTINFNSSEKIGGLKVELLDPQDYSVFEDVAYLSPPNQPKIEAYNTSSNTVRIVFEKQKGATFYAISYKKNGKEVTTKKTINSFIDITDKDVKQWVPCKYKLLSYNSFGKSKPSEPVEIVKNESELPPIIWNAKYTKNGVYLSYSVSHKDYLYELRYGKKSGEYTHKLVTKLKGVLNIPDIEKNEKIYLQMRVVKQWGFTSDWTHEIEVK